MPKNRYGYLYLSLSRSRMQEFVGFIAKKKKIVLKYVQFHAVL